MPETYMLFKQGLSSNFFEVPSAFPQKGELFTAAFIVQITPNLLALKIWRHLSILLTCKIL